MFILVSSLYNPKISKTLRNHVINFNVLVVVRVYTVILFYGGYFMVVSDFDSSICWKIIKCDVTVLF